MEKRAYNVYLEAMESYGQQPMKYHEWLELWNEEREVR